MSSKVRTFIDAGMLIAAARGVGLRAVHAGMVINHPDREYVSSVYLQLGLAESDLQQAEC